MKLHVVPIELTQANELVDRWHRHHKPVTGHRFSIGAATEDGTIVGAAIVGRPVARLGDASRVLEITRLVTDGTPNACSFLYQAAARVGKALGYKRIQTFILESEPGTSLRAAGWRDEGKTKGGSWGRVNRPRRTDQPTDKKRRWSRTLVP